MNKNAYNSGINHNAGCYHRLLVLMQWAGRLLVPQEQAYWADFKTGMRDQDSPFTEAQRVALNALRLAPVMEYDYEFGEALRSGEKELILEAVKKIHQKANSDLSKYLAAEILA